MKSNTWHLDIIVAGTLCLSVVQNINITSFTPSSIVYLRKKAPLGDPIEITIRGYELTLRKEESAFIDVELIG